MRQITLLEGNIRRELVLLAAPMLAGNVLQQLYNMADSLIVGQLLGTNAFASTGVSGTVINLFIFMLSGFCAGLAILFGQNYGNGALVQFRRTVFAALTVGSGVTLLLSGTFLLLVRPVLGLIHTPDELLGYCLTYLRMIVAGLICTYFYNLFSAILNSVGDTQASLCFLLISVCVNVALDYVLIGALGMGICGAACATVAAQLLSALCCLLCLHRKYPHLLCTKQDAGLHRALLGSMFRFGLTAALHQSTLYIGKLLVQGAVNTLGTSGIAAYTAVTRLESFVNSFGDSGAQSISIFIAQNTGNGNKKRVQQGLYKGMGMLVTLGLTLSVLLYAIAGVGVRLFLDGAGDGAALASGVGYLRMIALFYVLCFIGNAYVGYYRGIGRVMVPFVGTTLHLSVRVILACILVRTMGLQAVALATGIGWVVVVTYQTALYVFMRRRGRQPEIAERP